MTTQNTQWPKPIAFSDRTPTREDANKDGFVLIWEQNAWISCRFEHLKLVAPSHWLPQPPAPMSAEDAAFEEAMSKVAPPRMMRHSREIWDAAKAHFARKGGK